MRRALVVLPLVLLACGPEPRDETVPDAGDLLDAGADAADAGDVLDAGEAIDAGEELDAGNPNEVPDTPVQCSSNRRWTGGDRGSSSMHPGVACLECHDTESRAPNYRFAGTIYRTTHEPDDCYGASGFRITLIGANGAMVNMTSNVAGNFYTSRSVTLPYTVQVTGPNGAVRAMTTPVRSGDCNLCHTQDGTTVEDGKPAPGRIVAP